MLIHQTEIYTVDSAEHPLNNWAQILIGGRVDNTFQWINLYPVDNAVNFVDINLLDSH